MVGKKVIDINEIHTYEIRLDRKDLQTGVYFYQFMNNNNVVSIGKLVIQ